MKKLKKICDFFAFDLENYIEYIFNENIWGVAQNNPENFIKIDQFLIIFQQYSYQFIDVIVVLDHVFALFTFG